MWFRNPFPRFDKHADFQIASDKYSGKPEDLNNLPNGGFLFARSNPRTISFYKYWYTSRLDYPGLHDQDVLNQIKADQDFWDIGLNFRFLDTLYFSGFCQVSTLELFNIVDELAINDSLFLAIWLVEFGSALSSLMFIE